MRISDWSSDVCSSDLADLDAAVEGALAAKFRNAGQTCVCANRLFVQDGVYDAFAAKFVAAVARLKVGDGFDRGVTIGPLIDAHAVAKVAEHRSEEQTSELQSLMRI